MPNEKPEEVKKPVEEKKIEPVTAPIDVPKEEKPKEEPVVINDLRNP